MYDFLGLCGFLWEKLNEGATQRLVQETPTLQLIDRICYLPVNEFIHN